MKKPTIPDEKIPTIRKTYSPTDAEHKVIEHVYERFHNMKNYRERFDKNWDDYEKQWEGYREPKTPDQWQSNIVVPLSTAIVETIMAEVQQHEIEIPIKARGPEDLYKTEIMKQAIKFSKQQGNFALEEHDIKKDAFVYGVGWGEELYWQNQRELRFVKDKWDPKKGKITFEDTVEAFDYDGLILEHVPVRDMYFDEAAKTVNQGRRQANDAIREMVMTEEAFWSFFNGSVWDQRDAIEHVQPGKDASHYWFYQPPGRIDSSTEVQVLFYWCKVPDRLAIVANDVLMYEGPNPYNHKMLPFAQAYDVKRTNSIYHKGEMELIESLQDEVNTLRRSRLDRVHLTIDPMWIVPAKFNVSEDDLISRPHGMVEVNNMDEAPKELRASDTPASAYKEEQMIKQDAQLVTGIDEGSMSIERTNLTATQFAGLRESTLKKIALKLWQIHNGFHVSHTRLRVANILQFWTKPKYQRVLGPEKSVEFEQQLEKMKLSGREVRVNPETGEFEMETYPRIRLSNQQIVQQGQQFRVVDNKGDTFFEVKPETIMPFYSGFDIEYSGTPYLPLTKALLQTKASEMIDRTLPLALQGVGGFDPAKIMEYYFEVNDTDPDRFRTVQEEAPAETDQLGLAQEENIQLQQGNQLPPTPYATQAHTKIHIDFMKSDRFKQAPEEITQIFANHVMGEIMSQRARAGEDVGAQMQGQTQGGGATTEPGAPEPVRAIQDGRAQSSGTQTAGLPPGGRTSSSPIPNAVNQMMRR